MYMLITENDLKTNKNNVMTRNLITCEKKLISIKVEYSCTTRYNLYDNRM